MSDVFISYSRDDLSRVQKIAEAIQREGYDLWWDKDLPPHRSYGDVIQEKIGGAKAVVVVWSEAATKSEWVRAEADMARNQRKLIQTSIDDGMPPLPFNQIQYALLSDWDGEDDHPAWQKVLVSLSDLTGLDAVPAPAPPPRRKAAPAPAPVASSEPEKKGNQLPLILSLVSLVAVAGLVAWVLLGDDKDTDNGPVENTEMAEVTEPAAPGPTQGAQPAGPAKPEQKPAVINEFNESAMIEDADGWTNFRAQPSRSSSIIGRVETGEIFYTHKQSGQWWKIRTDDGTIGYMHYSRIALTASRRPPPKLFFPDSDSRLISPEELGGLSTADLRLARNEIFARKGRIFSSPELRDHFTRFDWYQPTSTEVDVNDIEKANAKAMLAEEQRR